jgi:hypothetical protein
MMDTTRTIGTSEQYRARGASLMAQYSREASLDGGIPDPSPVAFVSWLLLQSSRLRPGSWRIYRLSAEQVIMDADGPDAGWALSVLRTASVPTKASSDRKTSALRMKRIPKEHYDRLCAYLVRPGASRRSYDTRDWLVAAVATGLRPGEWREAVLDEVNAKLTVRNEKATNGRALGTHRTLDLSRHGIRDMAAIRRMCERGCRWHANGVYDTSREACSAILRKACLTLWPGWARGYALYSARHQAVANMKASMPLRYVAAALGHRVTDTSVSNYGKRRCAWKTSSVPRPNPEAAAQVLENHRMSPFRSAQAKAP